MSNENDKGTTSGYAHTIGCDKDCPEYCSSGWKVSDGSVWVNDLTMTMECEGQYLNFYSHRRRADLNLNKVRLSL